MGRARGGTDRGRQRIPADGNLTEWGGLSESGSGSCSSHGTFNYGSAVNAIWPARAAVYVDIHAQTRGVGEKPRGVPAEAPQSEGMATLRVGTLRALFPV